MSKCYTLRNFDGSTTLLSYILNIYYPHSTFSEEEGSFDESQWEQNNLLDNTVNLTEELTQDFFIKLYNCLSPVVVTRNQLLIINAPFESFIRGGVR